MNIRTLSKIFSDKGCDRLYIKRLAANDNSKNQVYFGGSFEVLNILPITEIIADDAGDWSKTRFKAKLNYYWIQEEGNLSHAPDAQLILYPKYPEVRFSGFLNRSAHAPSELMASRIEGRMLFIGVSNNGKVIGYVTSPDSELTKEFEQLTNVEQVGVFKILNILQTDGRSKLLQELKRINYLGWIDSKRFDRNKNILPCIDTNCGGYTLEAELGITPNGYSEPDYFGWEIKQFAVTNFDRINTSVITLMTPEPTDGFYVTDGIEEFIKRYGYDDKKGREARMNFGGIHKFMQVHSSTNLEMILEGYDNESGKIKNAQGYLGLRDSKGNIAASWSFASILKHWNNKHSNACYVPSIKRLVENSPSQQYHYSNKVLMGSYTDFSLFLKQVALGNIYYDPGIKLEFAIAGKRKQNIKRRSQFRIKSNNLISLYKKNEIIDVTKI